MYKTDVALSPVHHILKNTVGHSRSFHTEARQASTQTDTQTASPVTVPCSDRVVNLVVASTWGDSTLTHTYIQM